MASFKESAQCYLYDYLETEQADTEAALIGIKILRGNMAGKYVECF